MIELQYDDFERIGKQEEFESISLEMDMLLANPSPVQSEYNLSPPSSNQTLLFDEHPKDKQELFQREQMSPLVDPLEWAPERERRMSYECFDFPNKSESFDQPVQERYLVPRKWELDKKDPDDSNCTSTDELSPYNTPDDFACSISNNDASVYDEPAEELLTRFDQMHYKAEPQENDQDFWAKLPTLNKKVCTTPAVKFKNPPLLEQSGSPKNASKALKDGKSIAGSAKVINRQTYDTSTSPTSEADKTILSGNASMGRKIGHDELMDKVKHSSEPGKMVLAPTDRVLPSGERKIGIYTMEQRKLRIQRFHEKRKRRIWRKCIKYDCRKKLADDRPRVKGRFVRRPDANETKKAKAVPVMSNTKVQASTKPMVAPLPFACAPMGLHQSGRKLMRLNMKDNIGRRK